VAEDQKDQVQSRGAPPSPPTPQDNPPRRGPGRPPSQRLQEAERLYAEDVQARAISQAASETGRNVAVMEDEARVSNDEEVRQAEEELELARQQSDILPRTMSPVDARDPYLDAEKQKEMVDLEMERRIERAEVKLAQAEGNYPDGDEIDFAAEEARLEEQRRELYAKRADASMATMEISDEPPFKAALDETIPGGRYLVGGTRVGGKLVGARWVDANGRPIPAPRNRG
jgi:hypothetical protein